MRSFLLAAFFLQPLLLHAEIPLTFGPRAHLDLRNQGKSVAEVTLQNGNPHLWTGVVPKTYDPEQHSVFAFDYFAPTGLESVRLSYRSVDGMNFAGSKEMPLAETWQPIAIDLSRVQEPPAAGADDMRFHLSFRGKAGTQFQIRSLHLRKPTAEDRRNAAERDKLRVEREADARIYLDYLRSEYPSSIDTVHVGIEDITLIGKCSVENADLFGVPAHLPSHRTQLPQPPVAEVQPNEKGGFRIVVPRFASPGGPDRSLWRWRLADEDGDFLSPCRWPTVEGPAVGRRSLKRLSASHVKGLGGMPTVSSPDHEIFDLGIAHATMNFVLTSVLHASPRRGTRPWEFEGRTYHVNEAALRSRDVTVRNLSDQGVIVTCILLVGNHRGPDGKPHSPLTHPEAEARGIYSMPDLTTSESTAHYRATMHFLTERLQSRRRRARPCQQLGAAQ